MNIGQNTTNPGQMRTLVSIQQRALTTQTGGFLTPSWETLATVWAKWTNVHGAEVWQAQAIQAVNAATVLMRYREGVDTTCALLKGTDLFEIVSVDNVGERGEYMELKVRRMSEG